MSKKLNTMVIHHTIRVVDENEDDVTIVGDVRVPEVKQRAQLFAAAPELLDAAKQALDYLTKILGEEPGPEQPVSTALADAINKAEGR